MVAGCCSVPPLLLLVYYVKAVRAFVEMPFFPPSLAVSNDAFLSAGCFWCDRVS